MSKKQVTPGPWTVGGIADPYGPRPHTAVYGKTEPGMQSGPLVCRGMSVPDGNLIAAAPDLLAACKKALDTAAPVLCTCGKPDCATTVLRAAIAKAEGK